MYFIWDWKSNVPFIILYFWYNKQFITQMFSRYECFSPLENKLFPSLTNAPGKYHLFIVREINFHIALPSCNNTCSIHYFSSFISPNMFSYQYEQVLLITLWLILYVLRRYNKGHQSSLPSSLRRVQPLHTWHGRVYSGLYRGRSSRPRSDAGHSGRYPNSLREVYLQGVAT